MRKQLLLLVGLIFLVQSCKTSEKTSLEKPPENVIATFADEEVTLDELKINFNRNRSVEVIDSSEIQDFYPSYINYRLKLYEGYQQGYHKDSTILAEFNNYASEIADRYWIENQIKNERIETFSDRFEHELKAFHIFKEVPQGALPADTLEIYNSLISVRDSLLNGADPEEMNQKYSSKREDRAMGGQLSWITAGNTIESFEEAVYSLEPGEISNPVRSQFGYHLIYLQEIRPRTPQRLVKHIFVRKAEDDSGQQKINRAYEALEADSSWSDVLQKYTEDPSSKNRDGSLGWVGYGARFPQELVEAAIQTKPELSYSEPYEVSYGYHIMKVDSVRTFENEEQREDFITNRMDELGRLNPDRQDVYNRIAEESDLMIYRENFSKMLQNRSNSSDSDPQPILNLIEFNNQTYTSADFQYWVDNVASSDDVLGSGNLIESYRDYIIKENYVDYSRNRFPEFANQVDHFLEGLIVFKVNEENIWNPEAVDTSKLKAFYESNRSEYKKGTTFHYTTVSATSDSLGQVAYQKMTSGESIDKISEQFDGIVVSSDSTDHPQNSAYSVLESLEAGEFSEPVSVNNRVFIYILNGKNEERILSFDEAFDQVFSDYQPIREENYIDQLKRRYDLQLYPKNLE